MKSSKFSPRCFHEKIQNWVVGSIGVLLSGNKRKLKLVYKSFEISDINISTCQNLILLVNLYYKCTSCNSFYKLELSLKEEISIDFNSGPLDAVIILLIESE